MKTAFKFFKNYLPSLTFIAFFLIMLCMPQPVFTGASKGLLLWFRSVLPALFPFILVCGLLIQSGTFLFISRFTAPFICRIFHVSSHGSFAVLTGFLCGYPMGSKVTADLYQRGYINRTEGQYLLSFCNNTSPMFILSFIVLQNLKSKQLMLPSVFILFFSPICCSYLFRKYLMSDTKTANFTDNSHNHISSKHSMQKLSFAEALDLAVSGALESIAKVGGYIILFCVVFEILTQIPYKNTFINLTVLPSLEITNGIAVICTLSVPLTIKYTACMALTSFGGWCAAAQTMSMLKGTGIKIFPYLIQKLVTALVTSLFSVLYLYFFY